MTFQTIYFVVFSFEIFSFFVYLRTFNDQTFQKAFVRTQNIK